MKRGAAALLLLLLCMSSSFGIFIKTVDLQEIYSGPDGVPLPGWDTVVDPYTYTKYQSVAEFVFTMSDVMYEYEIMPEVFAAPIVTVESGEDVVEPFTFGDASSGNYFAGTDYYTQQYRLTVVFDCQKSGKAVLSVELTTGLVDEEDGASSKNETIKFYFQKECKEEDHRDGFSVGRGSNSDNVVKHGVVQHRWAMESYEAVDREPVIMDSEEHQTVFHISMSAAGYGNQYFYPPTYVVEDDDMVDIQLRSEAIYGGVATSAVPHTLVVYYDCLASGDTEITISIDIGFYGVLQFGFTKVCALKGEEETGMPGQINVGMSRSNYAGIVTNSLTSPDWTVHHPTVQIPADQLKTTFYVSTVSGKNQEILKPLVTVDPPNAFRTALSGTIREGGVVTGSPHFFNVNYLCDRVATGTVTVSLKMPHAKTVEFSYIKECKAVKFHEGHYWTANQLLLLLLLSSGLLACGFVYYRKQRAAQLARARSSQPRV